MAHYIGEWNAQSNLVGLWHLEDTTDSSGNAYNLTNNNTVTFSRKKIANGANFVAASSQSLSIADASCPNLEILGSQTWMCWVNFSSTTGTQIIATKKNAFEKSLYKASGSTLRFYVDGLTTNVEVNSGVAPSTNTWYHIAGVYDSANSKLKIWVNGVKTEVTASGTPSDTNGIFYIGRNPAGSYLDGSVDEFAMFSRALSDSEILKWYAFGKGKY